MQFLGGMFGFLCYWQSRVTDSQRGLSWEYLRLGTVLLSAGIMQVMVFANILLRFVFGYYQGYLCGTSPFHKMLG